MEEARQDGEVAVRGGDAVARAGEALRSAAARLRTSGALERDELRRLQFVPRGLETVGEYLERRKLPGIRADVERLVVARPLVAVLAAVAVGYLAGRVVRR